MTNLAKTGSKASRQPDEQVEAEEGAFNLSPQEDLPGFMPESPQDMWLTGNYMKVPNTFVDVLLRPFYCLMGITTRAETITILLKIRLEYW